MYIAVARGEAAFANLTHPQPPALAGVSVETREVIRFWITVGINLYIIAFLSISDTAGSACHRFACQSLKTGGRFTPSKSRCTAAFVRLSDDLSVG